MPPCYEASPDHPHLLPPSSSLFSRARYAFRSRNGRLQVTTTRSKSNKASDSFRFNFLPTEIQDLIWELLAQEPRIVSVRVSRERGPAKIRSLISSTPTILHICSRSRAIGLKYMALSFASKPLYWLRDVDDPWVTVHLAAKVYFNFEIDILWFGPCWNQGVDGEWCCINQLPSLVNLIQVRRMGFDLNSRNCSTRRVPHTDFDHSLYFDDLKTLEKIYLGLCLIPTNDERHPLEISLRKLKGEDEETKFMQVYDEQWRMWSDFSSNQGGEDVDDTAKIGSWLKRWWNEFYRIEKTSEQFEPMIVINYVGPAVQYSTS
jgi:hypothetical protein